MKTPNYLTALFIALICIPIIVSCNKDNIEELEKRIAELEELSNVKDSVIFSDLVISSQESMDIMAGRGIKHIMGVLSISNCNDITPLIGLKSVGGLHIEIPSGLNSLSGLDSITELDMLSLYFEDNIIDLSALDNLERVNSLSLVGKVPSSINFAKVISLESLYIEANSNSITISGFDEVTDIDYLYLNNYSGGLAVDGFTKLSSAINLSVGAEKLNISGFNALTSVSSLDIYSNDLNCSGLNGLKSLESVFLYGYHLNISGFNGLTSLGSLGLSSSTLDITGFENLVHLDYLDASIEHGVNGLNKIKSIGFLGLNIGNSDNFLLGLSTVGSLYLYSYYNRTNPLVSLADLGMTSLQSISAMQIELPQLESLNGFNFNNSNIEQFSIYYCPKLTDITALSTYSGPLMALSINTTGLMSLEGLENVTNISYLNINDNAQLENWCAIKDIFDNVPVNQRNILNNLLNPASSEEISGCN